LDEQRWGWDGAVAQGRVTLTCLAFNTAQTYRLQVAERLAQCAIRRLRRERQPQVGPASAVIYVGGSYAAFAWKTCWPSWASPRGRACVRRSCRPRPPVRPPDPPPYLQMSRGL
jgi:hypothetical protein